MKYFVLVIDYQCVKDRFELSPLEATNEEDAWLEVEDYQSNNSQEILLSEDDLKELGYEVTKQLRDCLASRG